MQIRTKWPGKVTTTAHNSRMLLANSLGKCTGGHSNSMYNMPMTTCSQNSAIPSGHSTRDTSQAAKIMAPCRHYHNGTRMKLCSATHFQVAPYDSKALVTPLSSCRLVWSAVPMRPCLTFHAVVALFWTPQWVGPKSSVVFALHSLVESKQ